MIKKTYIPGKPRNPKLTATTGASGVSKTEFKGVVGSSHEHYNKGVLDQITEAMLIGAVREMITSTDSETELTDENILSALRVLSEISKANADLLNEIKSKFLSKVEPDTAQELITFAKGLEVGTFSEGALGSGAAIKMLNGTSYAEVDHLLVRQKATFVELVIESLKHVGGQLILSPARMKCVEVVDGGSYYRCYFDNDGGAISNEFVAGDQARCQVFTGSGTKFYWRLVTSVGDDWINLSKTDAVSGSDIPEAGDDIVQLGNRNDTTRQSAIILSTIGDDAPSWKQYSGINSFDLANKETTVFTRLGNRIQGKTVFRSDGTNYDDWSDSVASDIQDAQTTADGKSTTYLIQPTSYKLGDMWVLNSDITLNGTAYKQGEILTATQDSTTFNEAHWLKRVRYTDDTAVNNLQIGGRNLILNTTIPRTYNVPGWVFREWFLSDNMVSGWHIIRFKYTIAGTSEIGISLGNNGVYDGSYELTPTFTAGTRYYEAPVYFTRTTQNSLAIWTNAEITISELMLVRGNKIDTVWSPAPEDINNKVDGIKIGGRNYWLNSLTHTRTGAGGWSYSSRDLSSLIPDGTELTIQFDIEVSDAWNLTIYKSSTSNIVWGTTSLSQVKSINLVAGKQTINATFNYDSSRPYVLIYNNTGDVRTSVFTHVTLSVGNKAVWSEAPEDVQARIDAEKTRINDILSDNVADPSEKQYLSNLWQEIYAEYPRIWAQANDYSVSKTTYEQKYTALKNILDPVLANLTVNSTVTGSSIRTAFSQYYDARTALQNAITNKVNTVAAEAQAKANKSAAITDKFATEINGGLITTVMMLLREANSQINTAGFSGIQKDNNGIANQPSYWSGGTYEQAMTFVPFVKKLENEQSTSLAEYNNLPKIVFLHSGAAKVGHFIVLTSGEILIVDPSTGSVKLKFTTAELPSITDLVAGTNSQGSTAVGAGVASISSSQVVSGSTQVSKNGAIATFNGTHISLSARGIAQAGGMASFAEAVLYARQNGVRVQRLASVAVHFTNTVYEDKSAEVLPVPFSFPLDAGTYTFELVIHTTGTISSGNATTSSSNFSWKHTVAGVKKQQYSKDGMMFFYSNRHFYFHELTGLDVKESDPSSFNMPGVLAAGSVDSGGAQANVWGAKSSSASASAISGGRSVPLSNMKHSNYVVQITPHTATTFRVGTKTISSFQALGTGGFDYVVIGNNY